MDGDRGDRDGYGGGDDAAGDELLDVVRSLLSSHVALRPKAHPSRVWDPRRRLRVLTFLRAPQFLLCVRSLPFNGSMRAIWK